MMEQVRYWAFGLCAAAIACGLIRMILPKSGMQRIFQVVASVFFLGCLLSPVLLSWDGWDGAGFDKDLSGIKAETERRSEQLQSAVEEEQRELASGSVREQALQVLEGLGVENGKIYVNVHDTGDGSISISECEVELSPEYEKRHDEIRKALMDRLGIRVVIGYVQNKE